MEKMSESTNAINWFEIPVSDMQRAKKFYETLFDIKMQSMEMMGFEITFFPGSDNMIPKVTGSLVKGPMHKPSMDGAVLYLNANPDIQTIIDRVEHCGGKLITNRTLINEQVGYMAFIIDTEGNRLALHAAK
jgi:uncharacterized protein